MYIVRFCADGLHQLACGTPKDLFATICILDSSHIEWWEIQDYEPRDFGWAQTDWRRKKSKPAPDVFIAVGTIQGSLGKISMSFYDHASIPYNTELYVKHLGVK